MLIGIDASRANRSHKSGTEWYSYYLIRWLAKLDSKNQYILYTDSPLSGGLADLTSEQHVCDLRIPESEPRFDVKGFQILKSRNNNFKAKVLNWPFNFFWTQGRLSLEMLFNKPDVLFIPAHTLPIIHPKKSLVTIHDIGFMRDKLLYGKDQIGPENTKGKKIINLFVKLFTRGKYGANSLDYNCWSTIYALKHSKKIITVSNFSKNELMDVFGNDCGGRLSEKILVINNGYNKFLYKKITDNDKILEILDKYGIAKPYISYIGRLEKKKNTPALIEAFALLKENNKNISHKLVLVGDASFGYDEVNYMIEEFLLDNEVIMPGWVEEEDMPYIYSGASVFIFPSLYEGFGIPLLQAMACGVPIAAANAASIPEVVDGAGVLFDPHNICNIAESMKKIISDKELREKIIKAGEEKIKNYGWEKCAKETLQAIENL